MRSLYLLAAAAVAVTTGCSLPLSDHPLSDEQSSVVDPRLIGHWEVVPGPDEPQVAPRFVLGKSAGRDNVLEMVSLSLEADIVKVNRAPAYATQLGSERYLSILQNPEAPKDSKFLLLLYRLEGDRLSLYSLRPDVVGPAIERGDLRGEIEREPPDPEAPPPELVKPKYKSIKITASTAELVKYFTPRGAAPFFTQHEAYVLRRVEPQ